MIIYLRYFQIFTVWPETYEEGSTLAQGLCFLNSLLLSWPLEDHCLISYTPFCKSKCVNRVFTKGKMRSIPPNQLQPKQLPYSNLISADI